jgi:signal transduction histidine kinase
MSNSGQNISETVLILAPTFNDASIAVSVLVEAGIYSVACKSLEDLCVRLGKNLSSECGAIIISEEAIGIEEISYLRKELEKQPPWSDIPIILLTGNDIARTIELFSKSGNISLLERPFSRLTLIRSVEVALRARRKQYEVRTLLEALHQSKEDAEKANFSKTQFLANMSHEIRTPIGAILGFTDLMKNPVNAPEENIKYMGIVERNSQQLLRLIDDILDLSKVEAGKMTMEIIEFSLTEMLADFISVMTFKAQEKQIKFKFKFDSPVPDIICSDPVRLRQILINIVGNALKFTDQGHVELRISFANPVLKFTIADTGIGISKAQESHLFLPFSQADTSTTRKFGGTGLGLVLSRRLANALGGKLELIESKEGHGSTFLIEIRSDLLPHAKLVSQESLASSSIPLQNIGDSPQVLRGLKVLLVEDSLDNQMLITTYLSKEGAQVKSASDGVKGIELALAENFDLLLMDIQMPILDGHKATRKLRKLKYSKPIIALTAHAMKEERIKCFESGFTEFLTKPIQKNRLIETLSRYTPQGMI